jgi:hypothetical protein
VVAPLKYRRSWSCLAGKMPCSRVCACLDELVAIRGRMEAERLSDRGNQGETRIILMERRMPSNRRCGLSWWRRYSWPHVYALIHCSVAALDT